jgi:hypothetical protein
MENNNNLVSIEKLKNIIKEKKISKYIKDIGYSKVKNKKYYVITIDNKRVNFGDIRYQDYLSLKDKKRRDNFRSRFEKLYNKFKNNYNKPIFWAVNLLW